MRKVHPDQRENKTNKKKKVKKKKHEDEGEDEVEKDIYDSLVELCAFGYYNSCIDYSLDALEVAVACININGADVNHWFGVDQKRTVLHLIALGSHSTEKKTEYIKYLLKNGANKDTPLEYNGYCPFLCAVSAGQLEMAQLFVDIDPSSINRCDQFCPVGTQVIVNVIKTQQSCLGTVIKINGDNNTTYDIKPNSGEYILESIQPAQLRVLYRGKEIKGSDYGEKVKIEFSEYGLNALHVACGSHEVSINCHDEMIEFLLQSGINPNKISNNGSTPLHLAAHNRLPKCIAVLLNNTILYDIEIYIKDFAGKTFVELMEVNDRVSLFSSLDYSIELLSAFNYFIWFALIQTDEPLSELKVSVDFGVRGSGVDPASVVDKCMSERYDILRKKVKQLVSSYPVLADVRNADGRSALDMASSSLRGILQEVLLWHGRYRVVESSPEHISATCCVYKAVDERQLDSSGQPSQVALKLMNTKSHFVREFFARDRNLSPELIVTVLHFHPILQSSSSSSSTEFPDIDDYIDMDMSKIGRLSNKDSIERMYLLVMPWGSRNLFTALKQERWAGRNQDEIRHVFTQLVRCVEHLHSKDLIHGDIKPLNFLRTNGQWQLIDLDAVANLSSGFVGLKYSSAYVPPEAIHVDNISCIASVKTPHSHEKLVAHQSFDVWALGCILYQMANIDVIPLLQGNQDDNLSGDITIEDNLYALADWTPEFKKKKLSRIADKQICNLLSQMLHKDPFKRPSLSRVLAHPFISLKKVTRLAGEIAKFDAFISYRVASDLLNAEALYNLLTSQGLSVFWDKVCLQPGEDWEKGFVEGLINSRSFVPLLSQEALNSSSNNRQNISKLDYDSPCDNVLLEYRLATELQELGFIEKIFPVFIGNYDSITDTYGNYFIGGCHPSSLPDIAIFSLEEKLRSHMEYQSLGTPISPDCTVKHTVTTITNCQGAFIEGRKQDSFVKAAESIVKMCTNTLFPPLLYNIDIDVLQ